LKWDFEDAKTAIAQLTEQKAFVERELDGFCAHAQKEEEEMIEFMNDLTTANVAKETKRDLAEEPGDNSEKEDSNDVRYRPLLNNYQKLVEAQKTHRTTFARYEAERKDAKAAETRVRQRLEAMKRKEATPLSCSHA
jgi:hypothetical protein